jgi:hypothetical protein
LKKEAFLVVHKSKFATFLLSLIPGVGHLYLGLNKRGLQLLIGAFACISFIPTFPLIFPFALTVIWFYGLFDALQKVTMMNAYLANRDTTFLNEDEFGDPHNMSELDRSFYPMQALYNNARMNPLWLGVGSIAIGVLVLTKILFPQIWHWLWHGNSSGILLALLMIGFGVWQLSKQFGKQ